MPAPFKLTVLEDPLAICRLAPETELPAWVTASGFFSATRTTAELSVVCNERQVPADTKCEKGWRALELEGPLEFGLTGVLSGVAAPLAEVGVSIFAVATYNTDYVLVREPELERAVSALSGSGYTIRRN